MKQLPIILLLLIITAAHVFALQIPQPQGLVNDFANVIDPPSKETLTKLLSEIEAATTAEVVIVTVPSLEGTSIDEYAITLAQKWGIGKRANDNGLLIVVAPNEREYRIEVGRGLEGIINDAKAGRIGRNTLVPNFKLNQYGKGIYEAVLEIKGLLENNPDVVARYSDKELLTPLQLYIALGYAIITFGITLTSLANKKINWKRILAWDGVTIALSAYSIPTFIVAIFIIFFVTIAAFVFSGMGEATRHTGRGGFFGSGRTSSGTSFGGGSFGGGGASGKW